MFFDHYPYTNFHNVNLDWVLEKVKEWGAMVEDNNQRFEDLKTAYEAFRDWLTGDYNNFKDYVTDYLQNLDVQAEINTKLDNMLESGELTPYLQPYIVTEVESWLDEHITPTTPAIDNTLTVQGAAADAKATGDAIRTSGGQLMPVNLSVNASYTDKAFINYSTGAVVTIATSNLIKASDFFTVPANTELIYTRIRANYTTSLWGVAFYDSNRDFISGEQIFLNYQTLEYAFSHITTPANAAYMRVSAPNALGDCVIYRASDLRGKAVPAYVNMVKNIIQALNDCGENLLYTDGIYYNSSITATGTVGTNNDYNTTGFISIATGTTTLYLNNGARYCFFDSNKTFLSTGNLTGVQPIKMNFKPVEVPQNAKYFRICILKSQWDNSFIYGSHLLDFILDDSSATATKKLYAVGDSITRGMYAEIGSSQSSGQTEFNYCYWLARLNGYDLTNLGESGTGYVAGGANGPYIADNNTFANADYITIAYGVNDYKASNNIPIGTLSGPVNDGSIIGNMRYTIETIAAKAPTAKIIIIAPLNGNRIMDGVAESNCTLAGNWYMGCDVNGRDLSDVIAAIKSVAEYYGITCVDLQQIGPANRVNIRSMLGDGLHPTLECHEMIGRILSSYVK